MFRRTGADVAAASNRQQIPAIYSQYFSNAWLGTRPAPPSQAAPPALNEPAIAQTPQGEPVLAQVPVPPARPEAEGSPLVPQPEQQPVQRQPREPKPPKEARLVNPEATRLNTIGASVGSTFAAPLLIGTVHGTWSPFKYSFAELGIDLGMQSSIKDAEYYSMYPFFNYALFVPFVLSSGAGRGGWYAGAGCGWMTGRYVFPEGEAGINIFALNIITGFNIANGFDLSWTMRTDFNGVNHKVSAGYVYRFK